MARTPLTVLPALEAEYHYCERCGLKVRVTHGQCPQCFGPVVRRNLHVVRAEQNLAARERAHRRAVRGPLLAAAAAVAVVAAGVVLGWRSGSSVELVVDPIKIGRPAADHTAPQAVHAASAVGSEFEVPAEEVPADIDAAFRVGELDRALAGYLEILERRPQDATALNNAGQVLVRMGRAAEAVPLLDRAVANMPRSWMAQFNLARALGETGEWARAAEHFSAAAMLMPDQYPILLNLGRALVKAGRDEAAAEAFGRATAASDAGPDAWLALGATNERLGKKDEARAAFERFVELQPDSPERAKVEQHIAALR